jgi:DNA-binding transcriptional ArsR family regulator
MDAAARAVAEPTRREILRLVHDQERTVTDIADHFDVSRPAISQHLRVLSDAELVTVRIEGTRRYYQTRPEGLAELAEWMQGFWGSSLSRLKIEAEREHWNHKKRINQQSPKKDKN